MPAKNPKITAENAKRLRVLGERIRARRKHLEINATVAAEAAGMSRITWYRIEKGEPSVTMGAWFSAVSAVGLALEILDEDFESGPGGDWIPTRIPLAEYPELRKLAWHARGTEYLSAREALDVYERNQRHLDPNSLSSGEAQLLEALRTAFGTSHETS